MILALRTDGPLCHVWIDDTKYTWEAGRTLAHGLLGYLEECLSRQNASWGDITGIVVFRGPGSFTGLRIGITVMNTIASGQEVPIAGETGDGWRVAGTARLASGQDDTIVVPEYGGDAHITLPRK